MCFQFMYIRLYKDLWNKDLAAFHIKEHLVLWIIVRVSNILDDTATNITQADSNIPTPKFEQGVSTFLYKSIT